MLLQAYLYLWPMTVLMIQLATPRHFYCVRIEPHRTHPSIKFGPRKLSNKKGDILIMYYVTYDT